MSRMVALDAPCTGCDRDMVPMGWHRIPGGAVRYGAHGLCHSCSHRLYRPPAPTFRSGPWTRDALLDEWDFLRRQGFTLRQATGRIGITYAALDRALHRAKGDPRAIRGAS